MSIVAEPTTKSLVNWFYAAGPEVQAALIGNAGIVLAALLTVMGTAWFATMQYRNERKEKARDRALAVKNDLLFESVKGASRALAALAALGSLDRTVAQVSADFQAGIATLTTAGAVADIETVAQGRDFLNAIGPAYLKRAVARQPIDQLNQEIEHIQRNMDSQISENQSILHIQRDALASTDNDRVQQTNLMFKAGHKIFTDMAEERSLAIEKIQPLHQKYVRETMAIHAPLVPIFQRYVAAVRKDIGIDLQGRDEFLSAAYIDPDLVLSVLNEALAQLDQVAPSGTSE